MPFLSRSRFCLKASAGQLKSLVLQREGEVSFIQLFSTSTSVCQGGGKRQLNTLCNSTRPDAVLLRFNVPFFCLCCCKRLAEEKSEQRAGNARTMAREKRWKRENETTAASPGLHYTTEHKGSKTVLHVAWQRQQR